MTDKSTIVSYVTGGAVTVSSSALNAMNEVSQGISVEQIGIIAGICIGVATFIHDVWHKSKMRKQKEKDEDQLH